MFPPNTSPAEWVEAFIDANPEFASVPPFKLGLWFLAAFEAGFDTAERGDTLDYLTAPPTA